MRGLLRMAAGSSLRHFTHVFLPSRTHLLKQARQKLCWQGACSDVRGARRVREAGTARASAGAGRAGQPHRHRALADLEAEGTLEMLINDVLRLDL